MKKIVKLWFRFFVASWFVYGLSDGLVQTKRALAKCETDESGNSRLTWRSAWAQSFENLKEFFSGLITIKKKES